MFWKAQKVWGLKQSLFLLEINGLVIGSPTYNREITGQLKTFYDRLWYDIHNQTFAGKYAICIILLLGYALRFIKSHHQAYISHRHNLRMMIGGGTSHTCWALSEMQRLKGGR